jgi:antitoxin component YwqK of YwqJK toxin-antitoxin module
MKRLLTTLCLVLLSIHSYSQGVIPEVETVTRDGLVYHQLSIEPLTGTVVSFHDNHRVGSRKNYRDGELDGLTELFHNNGQLWVRQNYKDGELNGLWEWFDRNGQLSSRTNYRDGLQDGLREEFSVNGNLIRTMTFRNGEVIE